MKKKIAFSAFLLALCVLVPLACLASGRDFSIDPNIEFNGGHTLVRWTDSDNAAPYTVAYLCADECGSEQQFLAAGGSLETAVTNNQYYELGDLIPGHDYYIVIFDKNSEMAQTLISLPAAEEFEDGKLKASSVRVSMEPRRYRLENGSIQGVDRLVASEIAANAESWLYGVYYEITLPELAYDRDYFVQVALRSPDGFLETVFAGQNVFGTGVGWSHYLRITGTGFFYDLLGNNGSIPVGDYTAELYLNGMLANTRQFKVR